jgi:glycosyltransferase involved in cell wall biosynthesis
MPVTTEGNDPETHAATETLDAPSGAPRPRVALVGPRADSRGGVAGTVRLLHNSRLAADFRLMTVSTYQDGTIVRKALAAGRGLALLAWLCASRRVDLVHFHASAGSSLLRKTAGVAVARVARVPVVFHAHGGQIVREERELNGPLGRLQRRALRWALRSSDAVVALTPRSRRSLAARTRIRRSCVIPNAPDLPALAGRETSGRNRHVLFLGHLYRDKGVYELLDAFARLRSARPGLRLVMAGEGAEARRLRYEANRLGLSEAVELPGWVGSGEKAELLAKAACLALPSHDEGFPLALLEAMLAGVPVVATSVGGVPEIVEDGRHALLVAPHDPDALAAALARVIDDPKLAMRLSEAASRHARAEYTPDRLAERVGALYAELLATR